MTPWNITLCPACGAQSSVSDSRRNAKSHTSVRRRRICRPCNRKWTTYEVLEEDYHALFATPKKIGTMIASTTSVLAFLRTFTKRGE